jgi:hypothetical protein
MLQVLPDTGLWHRLTKEGRLLEDSGSGDINQTTLMNFVPTRPVEEIAEEFVRGFYKLYDPQLYLDRTYQHYRILGEAPCHKNPKPRKKKAKKPFEWAMLRALGIICWRQGIVRETRFSFWYYLAQMFIHNRRGIPSYLTVCAQIEHFLEYREIVKAEIEMQLANYQEQMERREALKKVETPEAIAS